MSTHPLSISIPREDVGRRKDGAAASILWVGKTWPRMDTQSDADAVWLVSSGDDALDLLRWLHVDVVAVVHGELPHMTSWEFARRLRQTASGSRWHLVAPELSEAEEILARAAGVSFVWQFVPAVADLLQVIRPAALGVARKV